MIKFIPSVKEDIAQIKEWIDSDPWHVEQKNAFWWLTGSEGFFSCCIQDEIGPVVYVKVEEETDQFRLHCQFGPRSEVSRERLILVLNESLPAILLILFNAGKNVVFSSSNPSLIKFMLSKGFRPAEIVGEYKICADPVDPVALKKL